MLDSIENGCLSFTLLTVNGKKVLQVRNSKEGMKLASPATIDQLAKCIKQYQTNGLETEEEKVIKKTIHFHSPEEILNQNGTVTLTLHTQNGDETINIEDGVDNHPVSPTILDKLISLINQGPVIASQAKQSTPNTKLRVEIARFDAVKQLFNESMARLQESLNSLSTEILSVNYSSELNQSQHEIDEMFNEVKVLGNIAARTNQKIKELQEDP
jgi:hypothetical protein